MKHWKHTLGAAMLAVSLLTGGVAFAEGEEEPEAAEAAEVAEAAEEAETEVAAVETPAEEAPAVETPAEETAPAEAPMAGMANPYIEYPDVPALERAIGFPVLYLPSNFYALYHPAVHVFGIAGQVADLRFKSKADDSTITLRSALQERIRINDISGFYGVEWKTQHAGDVKRTKVDVAVAADGTRVVRWTVGRFVFALSVTGFDEEAFKPVLKNFVVVSNRFAHKYRNFRLNKPKKKTTQADVPDQAAAADAAASAPAGNGQATPAGNGQTAAAGNGQAAPAGDGQAAPAGNGQAAPAGNGQAAAAEPAGTAK